eukprot:TRINITY_DN119_c0_g1_i2.p1 TRINITY_DN119_c0_g1~~TRINITY_DN119_c0_g1_i2.p1  ORF type:complete len:359 (+),score=57.07 TRINITY_DN119_c0_g1_i2:318-1394(+)
MVDRGSKHLESKTRADILVEGAGAGRDISSKWIEENEDLRAIETGIPIDRFDEGMNLRNREVEFRIVRRVTETVHHSHELVEYNPSYNQLNRYKNVIPYKHSMVNLAKGIDGEDNNPAETYINANYINSGFRDSKKPDIIATQGPLEATRKHFWKMVWFENVTAIFMLCDLIDKSSGQRQCEQYWPKDIGKAMTIGPFKVTLDSEVDEMPDLTVHELTLEYENPTTHETSSRKLRHYWIRCWPDHDATVTEDFPKLEFLVRKMQQEKADNPSPLVVHCSAGIGRTGTLIALYQLVNYLDLYEKTYRDDLDDEVKAEYRISIFGTVRRIREQRWGLVQTFAQYNLIYEFIANHIRQRLQ